jgi:diketogulonate reductase-like aldo/keto reductase
MKIADELAVQASQVALKWTMQKEFQSIPIVVQLNYRN